MTLAPIILFAYNRPWHLSQTLEALQNNVLASESILYIYCDGAKSGATESQLRAIEDTRRVAKQASGFKSVSIVERPHNLGLAQNIITGVTEIINQYGRIIVLEDDLITSKYFLKFMNDSLELYLYEDKIISIGANTFFSITDKLPETFFLPIPDSWGWATWKDRWSLFEKDGVKLLKGLKDRKLIDSFNLEGAYDFYGMLENQVIGKIDSWAIRWQGVAYLNEKMTLYPGTSLTKNIGFGDLATHTSEPPPLQNDLEVADRSILVEKKDVKLDDFIYRLISDYYKLNFNKKHNLFFRIKKIIKYFIPNFLIKIFKKKLLFNYKQEKKLEWRGNYSSWEQAKKNSDGFDAPQILEKVYNSTMKVKVGMAKYERDSVTFNNIQYPWAVIAILLKINSQNNSSLHVVDFGGSLGTTYFQCRSFFSGIGRLSWSVIEQKHFVDCGKKYIADGTLDFFYEIDEVLNSEVKVDILIVSGTLQYLPDPYDSLDRFFSYRIPHIILDRTPFVQKVSDRLTLQYVPKEIYDAVFPAWFFNEDKMKNYFEANGYSVEYSFDSFADSPSILEDGSKAEWKGMLFSLT